MFFFVSLQNLPDCQQSCDSTIGINATVSENKQGSTIDLTEKA